MMLILLTKVLVKEEQVMLDIAQSRLVRRGTLERGSGMGKFAEKMTVSLPRKVYLFLKKKVKKVKISRERSLQGYRLLDMVILQDIISSLNCPDCLETGTLATCSTRRS